jgi:hypothetical protein
VDAEPIDAETRKELLEKLIEADSLNSFCTKNISDKNAFRLKARKRYSAARPVD